MPNTSCINYEYSPLRRPGRSILFIMSYYFFYLFFIIVLLITLMKASAESAEAFMTIMTSCPESAEAFMLIMTACRNFRQAFTNTRQAAGTSGKLSGSWGMPIYGGG